MAYLVAIADAFASPLAAIAVRVGVAVVCLAPDGCIARVVSERGATEEA